MHNLFLPITSLLRAKRSIVPSILLILSILIIAGIIIASFIPDRSVASYCNVYREENSRLNSSNGSTYSTSVFDHHSNDPRDFAIAFGRLEKVSPTEIDPDVKTLKKVFQSIGNDPTMYLSASISGLSAESRVKIWTDNHCSK